MLDGSFQNVGVYTPLSESVKRSMIELYEIGLIFRGCRKIMIDLKYGADGAGEKASIHPYMTFPFILRLLAFALRWH